MDFLVVDVASTGDIGGYITQGGNLSSDYTTSLTNYGGYSDIDFVTFNVQDLSADYIADLANGTLTATLTFTAYTNEISPVALNVYIPSLDSSNQDLTDAAVLAEISNPSQHNATKAYGKLFDETNYTYSSADGSSVSPPPKVDTVDLRKGSVFASSENENTTQTIDVTKQVLNAYDTGEPLLVWNDVGYTVAGDSVSVSNMSLTVTGVITEPEAVGGPTQVVGSIVTPFGGTTLSTTIPDQYLPNADGSVTVPFELSGNSTSTPLVDDTTAKQVDNSYLIIQSNASAGTLSGAGLMPSGYGSAGQASYVLSGTQAQAQAELQALVFTPSSGGGETTFKLEEFDVPGVGPAGAPVPLSGGTITYYGPVESSVELHNDVTELVSSGGATVNNTVEGPFYEVDDLTGLETVLSGGVASQTTVIGTTLDIQSGGKAVGTILSHYDPDGLAATNSSFEVVENGGTSSAADIRRSGVQVVSKGGVANTPTVEAGGSEQVYGSVAGAIVHGSQAVFGGGTVDATFVVSGGTQVISSGGLDSKPVVSSGGSATVLSGGAVAELIIAGGSAVLMSGAKIESAVSFAGVAGGSLTFGTAISSGTTNSPLQVQGFAAGDTLDLAGLTYTSTTTATLTGNRLTVTNGTSTEVFRFATSGTVSLSTFDDDNGGTEIYAPVANVTGGESGITTNPVACYASGTRILTDEGEKSVETLVIGDCVITASGQHRSIKWVGRRSYAGRFLAANPGVQPIRFHAGSLGRSLPRRDLLVSPEHAMLLDGLLIPARCLVNGNTIVRDHASHVRYHHVELDTHDVLLAEGAPSESFMDDDSRGAFHNAHEFAVMYPEAARPDGFCAPRVEQGAQLEAIRQRLAGEMKRAA